VAASATSRVTAEDRVVLLEELRGWVGRARRAGLDGDAIAALVAVAVLPEDIVAR
jgi:hypothetical protein